MMRTILFCFVSIQNSTTWCQSIDEHAVKSTAAAADVLIFLVGTGEKIESEVANGAIGATLQLPGKQSALIDLGLASGKQVVVLIFTASPKNGPWMHLANAVVNAGYPQNGGGAAIADVLLGRQSFSGKLSTTWPKRWSCDVVGPDPRGHIKGRCEVLPSRLLGTNLTYRYGSAHNSLFSFGYGLSYTAFEYSSLDVPSIVDIRSPEDGVNVSVRVANVGPRDGAEIVQAYVKFLNPSVPTTDLQLVAFAKVHIQRGFSTTVHLTIRQRQIATLHNASTTHSVYLDSHFAADTNPVPPTWVVEQGARLQVFVGGQQPSQPIMAPSNVLNATMMIRNLMTSN